MHAASEGFLSEVRSAWPRLLRVAPRFLLVACLIGASLAAVSFVSPSA